SPLKINLLTLIIERHRREALQQTIPDIRATGPPKIALPMMQRIQLQRTQLERTKPQLAVTPTQHLAAAAEPNTVPQRNTLRARLQPQLCRQIRPDTQRRIRASIDRHQRQALPGDLQIRDGGEMLEKRQIEG